MHQNGKHSRLLVVFGNLGIGGVQSKIVSISKYIERTSRSTHVYIVLRDKTEFRLDEKLKHTHVTIRYRPSWTVGFVHMPFFLYVLWQIIILQPHVILTFYDVLSSLSVLYSRLLFWRHIRIILNEDTLTSAHVISRLKRLLIRTFYPLANQVIVPTHIAKSDLVIHFGIPSAIIRVIPNWTELQSAHVSQGQKNKHRSLVFVGRFEKQKNLFFLLRALMLIKKSYPNIKLVMVGDGSEKQQIQTFVQKHSLGSNVVIKNALHSVAATITKTKMLVLTSRYEGMSVAVLEAMALGVPVVSLWHPGISEYLVHGKTGLVVHSQKEFISAVITILQDASKARAIAQKAKQTVRANFSGLPLHRYISVLLQPG